MRIYYRLCEKQNTLSFVPRWKNINKLEIIKKCWISMQQSIHPEDKIILVEDNVSDDTINWMKQTSKTKHIITIDGSFYDPNIQDYKKLANCIDHHTKMEPNDLHFLTADDYLYLPNALNICKSIYNNGWKGWVAPYDYPDRYTIDRRRSCDVFINEFSHWRTIPSSTATHMALGTLWQENMREIHRDSTFNSDAHTWKLYAQGLGICPIPGVATHLTEGCMTPLRNWESYWNSINV